MIASPCINVCRMEGELCAGCLRTLDELRRWGNAGDDERRLILAAVAQRRERTGGAGELIGNCAD